MKNKKKLNKKISTEIGVSVVLMIAIVVGLIFYLENKKVSSIIVSESQTQNQNSETIQEVTLQNTKESSPVEFPIIKAQPGMNMEDIIKQALYKKHPTWKSNNYNISVTIETNEKNHAIGRDTYDGYNVVKDGTYHNAGEEIWFAAKVGDSWTLMSLSGTGYWGSCQDFKKYDFPTDMIPDCWDNEKKILIDTSNPERFYHSGFAKADKKELVQAYIKYANENAPEGRPYWNPDKTLYVRIDKNVGNYLRGTFFISGSQNMSSPGFYATKQNGKWVIVYNGQDNPPSVLLIHIIFQGKLLSATNRIR